MKIAKLLLSLFLLVSILMPLKAYSLDITAGVATWYAWLDQSYTKNVIGNPIYDNTKNNPNLLFGPALSVKFNDEFNLTLILLQGKFNVTEVDNTSVYDINYRFERIDSDIALNYRLNDYFKIFAGVKYLSFRMDHNFGSGGSVYPEGAVYKINRSGFGPGMGFSVTYPVLESMFFVGNLSGFYLFGEEEKGYYPDTTSNKNVKTNCNDYGMNLTLSLAYYIAPAATTISLGGRAQFVKTSYDSAYDVHRYRQGDGYDTSAFWGITLTATYSFSI